MSLNRPASKVYAAVNECIYCGVKDAPLTKEHIVPHALAGNLLLPRSSCRNCMSKINSYETPTLQGTFGAVRKRLKFPSRHKSKSASFIEIGTIKSDGTKGRRSVPIIEYPVGIALPGYNRANIFQGMPAYLDTLGHVAQKMYLNGDLAAFKEKYNWDGLLRIKWLPLEFGQMIIKICYAYAVAELGINAFSPICLDHILKRNANISHVFGQNGSNEAKEGKHRVWELSLEVHVSPPAFPLLVVYCSIFPEAGTPIYEVAVGRISAEHVETWREMLATKKLVITSVAPMPAPF